MWVRMALIFLLYEVVCVIRWVSVKSGGPECQGEFFPFEPGCGDFILDDGEAAVAKAEDDAAHQHQLVPAPR